MSAHVLTKTDALQRYGFCEQLRRPLPSQQETYNPIQAIVEIFDGFHTYGQCCLLANKTVFGNPIDFFNDLSTLGVPISVDEVILVLVMATMWTIARFATTKLIYGPFAKAWGMSPDNVKKFPEPTFKATAYLAMWSYATYLTFFSGYDIFNKTLELFKDSFLRFGDYSIDLRLIYGIELSFYVHSIFATYKMDTWRRDSPAMVLHHCVTIALIAFAYTCRYLKIGLLIFVLDDICDVFLEAAKVLGYLRYSGSKVYDVFDWLANACAVMFTLTWVVCRNLFHLTKIWRAAAFGVFFTHPFAPSPFYLFFNILLGTLYVFYLYWFYFIVIFVYRLLSGQMKRGKSSDPREEIEQQRRRLEEEREKLTNLSAAKKQQMNQQQQDDDNDDKKMQ